MSLNLRQQRELRRIESRLLHSEPHLASMLAMSARLWAGQRMPAWEQEPAATRADRMRQAAVLIAKAITVMAAAIGLLVSAIFALVTALVIGSRSQPPQPTRQQTRPGTNGR
jgi:lipopolysaccharide/colanic/teichoic acid biosynthesis glycosyltransferase